MIDDAQSSRATIKLAIPAKAEYITLGRLALTGIGHVRQLSEETLSDLKLALTEACTNSVRHAYPDGGGTVRISYELESGRLAIDVSDDGTGFGSTGGRESDGFDESGLGIAIIRAIADELEISERPGGGSSLHFAKLLDG
ncbi:MAG: ATP-binding protein [Gaiellaceae bacterium]